MSLAGFESFDIEMDGYYVCINHGYNCRILNQNGQENVCSSVIHNPKKDALALSNPTRSSPSLGGHF